MDFAIKSPLMPSHPAFLGRLPCRRTAPPPAPLSPSPFQRTLPSPEIGDYDGDGIPDLMVKLDWAAMIALFAGKTIPGNYVMEVTGTVVGLRFKGTDTIRVISPP